ncbi:MAG: hypothetical protein RBS09_01875 [Anaerolineaceae bacterium]|jgi:hypothetical protein|nr:hypothetical protein [Anaerolineaceae bacterium]
MAKVNKPNDHELWLELLQIKPSRKGSIDEQRINEIIDRYLEDGLEFRDDPNTGLTSALSTLRKKTRRARLTKKVFSIILIVLAVGVMAWGGYKLYSDWNNKKIAQEHTQTAEFIAMYNTIEANTSTALALTPTQTNTPLPTATEIPTATPTPTPVQSLSTIARGACDGIKCRWESDVPILPGFYALFIVKDAQETKVISDNPVEISIDFANSLTIDLGQCVGLDKGEKCFVGLVDLMEPLSSVSGSSENLVSLEFVQILPSGETHGDVTDFLLPNSEIIDLPICQNGSCKVFGSYRPSRQLVSGSLLRLLPSQPVEGIDIYYISIPQSSNQELTPLEFSLSGWVFNEIPVDEGIFVVTSPVGIELAEDIILLVINPNSPEVQQ